MAVLLTDSFTGTNGAAWNASNWVNGRNPTQGGGATIQSNTGRLSSGTIGGYSGSDRVSRRVNFAAPAAIDMTFTFRFDATEAYAQVYVRANNAIDSGTGYFFGLTKGSWYIAKSVGYVGEDISPGFTFAYSDGTLYKGRFYAVGTSIKAKFWLASSGEPATWTWEGTDSSITAAGAVGFTANGGAAASSSNFYVDDVTISDGIANTFPTVDVGANATIGRGATFTRTANASDSDGSISSYAWTLESAPSGSVATPTGTATATVSFTPSVLGIYVLGCRVADNFGSTTYDELTLSVVAPSGYKKVRAGGVWQDRRVRVRQSGSWV